MATETESRVHRVISDLMAKYPFTSIYGFTWTMIILGTIALHYWLVA